MQRANYFPYQYVSIDDLNYTESSKIEEIQRHTTALLGYTPGGPMRGVIAHSKTSTSLQVVETTFSGDHFTGLQVTLGAGITSDGDLIIVSESVSMVPGGVSNFYTWPLMEEGLFYYVKIKYAETSGSVGSDREGNTYYKRYYPSFHIDVETTSTTTSDQLILASFEGAYTTEGVNLSDERNFIRTNAWSKNVHLDEVPESLDTVHNTLHDHIVATGSATPSNTNPHGLSISDILGDSDDHDAIVHTRAAHSAGLVSKTGVYASGFDNSYKPHIADASDDLLFFDGLADNMALYINGQLTTQTLDSITSLDIFNSAEQGEGYYYVYTTGENSQVLTKKIDNAGFPNWDNYQDGDKFILCKVRVTNEGHSFSFAAADFVDLRKFYTASPYRMQVDPTESDSYNTVSNGDNVVTNLNRIRYAIKRILGYADDEFQKWLLAPAKTIAAMSTLLDTLVGYFNKTTGHKHLGVANGDAPKLSANAADWMTGISTDNVNSTNLVSLTNGAVSNVSNLHTHLSFPDTVTVGPLGSGANGIVLQNSAYNNGSGNSPFITWHDQGTTSGEGRGKFSILQGSDGNLSFGTGDSSGFVNKFTLTRSGKLLLSGVSHQLFNTSTYIQTLDNGFANAYRIVFSNNFPTLSKVRFSGYCVSKYIGYAQNSNLYCRLYRGPLLASGVVIDGGGDTEVLLGDTPVFPTGGANANKFVWFNTEVNLPSTIGLSDGRIYYFTLHVTSSGDSAYLKPLYLNISLF